MNLIKDIFYQHIGMAFVIFILGIAIVPLLLTIWIAVIMWCLVDGWGEIAGTEDKRKGSND